MILIYIYINKDTRSIDQSAPKHREYRRKITKIQSKHSVLDKRKQMPDLGKTELKTKQTTLTTFTLFYTSKVKHTLLQKESGTLQYSSLKGANFIKFHKGRRREDISVGRDGKPKASILGNLNFAKSLLSYSFTLFGSRFSREGKYQ